MLPIVARGIASLAVRLIVRNPRLGKNLIKLFTGIPTRARKGHSIAEKIKDAQKFDVSLKTLLKDQYKGQWYSTSRDMAKGYASGPFGKIKTINVTPKELAAFYRYKNKLGTTNLLASIRTKMGLPNKRMIPGGSDDAIVMVPRYKLKTLPSSSDYLVKEKLRNLWKGIGGILRG